jgi:putative FmdB family regulatory protein
MPIYEYQCSDCNHRFEKKQSFQEDAIAECPECRAKARRVFKPVPIIFKGSGFYVTDHRSEPAPKKGKKTSTQKGEKA